MPPIQGWFKARKPLRTSRLAYYEDVYGTKNPEEDLEGTHILDSESDSDTEILGRKSQRKTRIQFASTTRSKMNRNSGEQPTEEAKSDDPMPAMMDRSTVVTIDDDSDVDELFVSDLRKHAAQDLDNNDNEGDANDIDPAFLAEVQRYGIVIPAVNQTLTNVILAAQPPRINADRNDKIIEEIDKRAQQFADQSPLSQNRAQKPEPNAEVVASIEQPVGRTGMEVSDELVDKTSLGEFVGSVNAEVPRGTHKSRTEVVPRAHSWDPSQSSDYVYSDEEVGGLTARSDRTKGNHDVKIQGDNGLDLDALAIGSPADDNDQVITAKEDEHRSNNLVQDKRSTSNIQNETIGGAAELGNTHEDPSASSEDDDRVQHVDLTLPTRRNRFSRPSNLGFQDRDQSTSPEPDKPDEAPARLRRKRFGLFASKTDPNSESESDTRPQRLQRLVRKRRRERKEREEQEVARKRTRYNLRPRQQQSNHDGEHSPRGTALSSRKIEDQSQRPRRITRSMTAAFETDDEVERPRRITRSMRTTKPTRTSIPRWKPARKTAPSMRITSKDDYHHQQTVQVVIPAVDKSKWNFTPSSTSLLEPKEKSPAVDRNHVTAAALAGPGMKRVIPNSKDIKEESSGNGFDNPQGAKQILEFVLID